jgi:hypothetical protein
MARLILNRDGVDLGTHELVPDMVMIGRAPLNHIVIDDPTVSAHHARLLRAAGFLLAGGFALNKWDTGQ